MTHQDYLKAFNIACTEMQKLTDRKNSDYAEAEDAFLNFKQIEFLTKGRISAAQGILVRMTDKMSRIASLLSREAKVKDEKIEDTIMDLAVYSIILKILLGEEK